MECCPLKQAPQVSENPPRLGPLWYSVSGRPGGVSGYPRAWYRSVSWVQTPPSAYSDKFVGTFSCAQVDLRKAREREFAKLDEKIDEQWDC